MRPDDPLAVAGATAIRTGDLAAIERLLAENPGLANVQIEGRRGGYRTPLHVVADWPGYFPNGPAMVRLLIAAGADPNGGAEGWGKQETPLHWAASSDDVDVAEALIDGGADVEAPGGSIADGSPLDNAIGYGCWRVARLLVARGAKVDKLWHAAALGMLPRLEELLPNATAEEVSHAFYQACCGGQRRAAELLRAHGADLNWQPDYAKGSTPLEAARGLDTGRQALITWLEEQGAKSAEG
ncbi:MAG TPA: ankyrin repeat domain-containing protein [Chloroflexota bacterium]|nr:ankyrin repeat domain-containing protein [Chloroflexota bacterium]